MSLVPVDSARDLGADIIIAVDVTDSNANSGTKATALTNTKLPTITSLSSFWGLLEYNLTANFNSDSTTPRKPTSNAERQRADIVITPNVSHISSLDTSQRKALISAGIQATTPQITAIKQLIAEKSASKYATL